MDVLYLCDREACGRGPNNKCYGCNHTFDVEHAVNFKLDKREIEGPYAIEMEDTMHYKTCKYCGAHLDPQESCDCMRPKCEVCGGLLNWGSYAFEQKRCWKCTRKVIWQIDDAIKSSHGGYPRHVMQEMLKHMATVYAEVYGEEFKEVEEITYG